MQQSNQNYTDREKWFQDRIGKRIYRNKTSCKCDTCLKVYEDGLIIHDGFHAGYLHDMENELIQDKPVKYFDTVEERNNYEN